MSTYLYTLRASKVDAADHTGISSGKISINLYSFVTGHALSDRPNRHVSACHTRADEAWETYAQDGRVPYVTTADADYIKGIRNGNGGYATVYYGCNRKVWYDTDHFPAEGVYGLLVQDKTRRLKIVSQYVDTSEHGSMGLTGNGTVKGRMIPYNAYKMEVIDGKVVRTHTRVQCGDGQWAWLKVGDKELEQAIIDTWVAIWEKEDKVAKLRKDRADHQHQVHKLKQTDDALYKEWEELTRKAREVKAKLADNEQTIKHHSSEIERLDTILSMV